MDSRLEFGISNHAESFSVRYTFAGVVKLVDTQDLGSCGFGCGGSSPFARTIDIYE